MKSQYSFSNFSFALYIAVILLVTNTRANDSTLYESRILPIAKSEKSSSCTECHFGGVELKSFIGDSEAEMTTPRSLHQVE